MAVVKFASTALYANSLLNSEAYGAFSSSIMLVNAQSMIAG